MRSDICEKFDLPIKLVLGRMKKLYMKIHWNALSSKPVVLEIDGLELVVSPLDQEFWEQLVAGQNEFEVLERYVLDHALNIFRQKALDSIKDDDEKSKKDNQGFFVNLVAKVVDNL